MRMHLRFASTALFLITYLGISTYFANRFIDRVKYHVYELDSKRSRISYIKNFVKRTTNSSKPVPKHLKKDVGLELKRFLEVDSFNESIGGTLSLTINESMNQRPLSNITESDLFGNLSVRTSGKDSKSDICKSLVSGNDKIRWRAMQKIKLRKIELSTVSDKNLSKLFNDCDRVSSFIKGPSQPIGKQGRPIAYSVLLNRPGQQTLQFLKAVYNSKNIYCLHVHSGATKRFYNLVKSISDCVDNIYLSPERFKISLATFERIEAHISCFRLLLNTTTPWRYLITLPGSVFPLRNNTFIGDYLEKRHYKNGLTFLDRTRESFIKRTKFVHQKVKHPSGYEIFSRTKRRKSSSPENITLFRSDSAFIATRGFVEFIINSSIAKKLLRWSKSTKNPEEFYWATLDRLPGTPGGTPYRPDDQYPESALYAEEDVQTSNENDLLARLWKSQHTHKCGGVYTGNLCIYNYKDLRWLVGQDYLFADAFDLKVDFVAISCLYRNLQRPLVRDFY